MLGRWARCKECGLKFRLSEPSAPKHYSSSVSPSSESNGKKQSAEKNATGSVEKQKATSTTLINTPSKKKHHAPPVKKSADAPKPAVFSRLSQRIFFKRSHRIDIVPSPGTDNNNKYSSNKNNNSNNNKSAPFCHVCREAALAGLKNCPSCGRPANTGAIAFHDTRYPRIESELAGMAMLSIAIGMLGFVGSLLSLLQSGSLNETLVIITVTLSSGGLVFGGFKLRKFHTIGRFLSAGMLLLTTGLACLAIGLFAENTAKFMWISGVSLPLLPPAMLCFLPASGKVCSASYQLAIQPEMRDDQPNALLPAFFLGAAAFFTCIYFIFA